MKEAKEIIEKCGLKIVMADDLEVASARAVKMAQIIDLASVAQLNVKFELPI